MLESKSLIFLSHSSFVDETYVCSLDIVEGVSFLVKFEVNNDFSKFTSFCKKEDDTYIIDKDVITK